MKECCGRYTADRKFLRSVQELAAADPAMHIAIKQIQKLLRKIRGFLAVHMSSPDADTHYTTETVRTSSHIGGLIPSFSAVTRLVSKLPSGCFTAVVTTAAPDFSSVLSAKT
jgi:hypothetical protein